MMRRGGWTEPVERKRDARPRRTLRLLVAVFFFSGLSSLIDQVAWQRMLTIHFGVGVVPTMLIVSGWMLGLGLGALVGGRVAGSSRHAGRLYVGVEIGLAIAGLLSLPTLGAMAVLAAAPPVLSYPLLLALLCVPTFLMGMTLPLLVTLVARLTGDFLYSVSRLYFINTIGAAVGSVLTGYVLISLLGLEGCVLCAAVIDVVLAAVVFLAWRTGDAVVLPAAIRAETSVRGAAGVERLLPLLVLITGFLAIGYEMLWYRVIGVLVKDSPYAFCTVLAVYLLGIALGSHGVHGYLAWRPGASRRSLFFGLQFLVGVLVLATFAGFQHLAAHEPFRTLVRLSFTADVHPSTAFFGVAPGARSIGSLFLLLDVFVWPAVFLLLPTILIGASFPLMASLAFSRGGSEGRAVGITYGLAVFGNVLGGLVTGLLLLPIAGTERTTLAFGCIGLLFGIGWRPAAGGRWQARAAGVSVLLLCAVAIFPRPGELYAVMHVPPFEPSRVMLHEGGDAVVVTYEQGGQLRNFINGQGHGYRPGPMFLAEAIEALSHGSAPHHVLVVGFGAGTIAEAALLLPGVEQVTVVELSPSLMANLRGVAVCQAILRDRRIRLVIDDGRRFLQRTGDTFDAILMDPLRTTTAYSNNLHSREFFATAAARLAPGGILMVGGVGDSPGVIARTLMAEFHHVRAYAGFCLASRQPFLRDEARLAYLMLSFSPEMQAQIGDLAQDALEGEALAAATQGEPINEDWRPASEYYLFR